MLFQVPVRIDVLAVAEIERMPPQQQEHHRRENQPHGVIGIHGPEFAAFHSGFQHALHQPVAAADDLVVVEFPDLREVPALREHQFGNAAELGVADRLPPTEDDLPQQIGRAALVLLQQPFAALDQRHDSGADDRLEQFFLAREIQIERAFADTGPGRHVIQPRRGVTAFDEQVERGGHQFSRSRLLAAGPAAILSGLQVHHSLVND